MHGDLPGTHSHMNPTPSLALQVAISPQLRVLQRDLSVAVAATSEHIETHAGQIHPKGTVVSTLALSSSALSAVPSSEGGEVENAQASDTL